MFVPKIVFGFDDDAAAGDSDREVFSVDWNLSGTAIAVSSIRDSFD